MACTATALCTPSAPAQDASRCTPAGAKTVFTNSKLRVFITRRTSATGGAIYYACFRETGRTVRLGRSQTFDYTYTLDRFTVAGQLLAYQRTRSGLGRGEQPSRLIVVRDLRSGRRVRELSTGQIRGSAFSESAPGDGVRDLELTSRADVAWIVQNPFGRQVPQPNTNISSRITEVYRAPRNQGLTLLDQGDTIAKASLRRNGCTIIWVNADDTRTAEICP